MFTPQDLEQLRKHGIAEADALRQIALFKNPPDPTTIERPCTVGDGVLKLSLQEEQAYEAKGAELLASGRVSKFVPASGAATRMFQAQQADPSGAAAQQTLARLADFAFAAEIQGENDPLKAVLSRYSSRPKALIPFHWHGDHSHTAFEDQLREALALGITRAHFTVSPEHRADFEAALAAMQPGIEVTFSEQKPSTDTLAADAKGEPFRDAAGQLVFRPAGHGALLENLNDLQADIVLIKNIDNISHSRLWTEQLRWKKILLGLLAAQPQADAPLRVAGVVKNSGEPGGGPFWVQDAPQIVESAQIDMDDPGQKRVFSAATHFNPVDLACFVKGFDLRRFRDDAAVFISKKSKDGKPLQALELPGLWNGGMAAWRTLFVEVPEGTFNPVKTLNDLLKPAHQPSEERA